MTPGYVAAVHSGEQTNYLSYVLSGLYNLRARDGLQIKFQAARQPLPRQLPHAQLWLTLGRLGERRKQLLFFDMQDRADIEPDALAACDRYIKRSYLQEQVDSLSASQRARVLPMGLHFPCTSDHETLADRLRAARLGTGQHDALDRSRRLLAALTRPLSRGHPVRRAPFLESDFIHSPDCPSEPGVYFRTRLFDPDIARDAATREHIDVVNGQRIAVIEALQRELGPRFQGGLYPTPATRRLRPDLIFDLPAGLTGQAGHFAMSRRYAIAINTEGVHHSSGWKIPESFAASRCMVGERMRYHSQDNPQPGTHYAAFDSPEEGAALCAELLDDPDRLQALRRAGFAFFNDHLRPGIALGRTLDAAWAS